MNNFFQKLLGVNWKTTLAGLSALIAIGGKIYSDIKTKDFNSFFSDAQGLLTDLGGLGIAIGLLHAKDNNTTTNPVTGEGEKVNPQ